MAEGIKDSEGTLEGLRLRNAELEARVRELEGRNRDLERELRPFHVLADNIPDHIYFKDKDCRFTWVNRNMYKLRGLESREALAGKTSFDIHGGERAQQAYEDDLRVVRTGEYILNKLESDHYADGSPMWVLTTKIPLRDAQGDIIGICGISKDFTKMVQAEEVLATEGALRNDLLENIPDCVWFKDRENRFTWVNKSVMKDLGKRKREDVIGKTDFDFFSAEHAREAREDELRIMETGTPLIDKLEKDNYADGTPRWVYTTKIPLHDVSGSIVGTCGVTKDVTALKKAEEAMAREGALLNDLLENVPDIVYFKDLESRFTWINKAMTDTLGRRSKAEIIGKTDSDFFTPEYAQEALADERDIIATGRALIDKLEAERLADGKTRSVYTTKMPLHDAKGKIVGTCGISRDVTALKRAEEALALESNLLNAMLTNIPDAIYFKDTQSRFVRVSKAIHLEGLRSLDDAIGKTDFDFFTRDHAQQAFNDEQEIIKTGIPIVDKVERETFNNNRPDAWVSTTKVPIYGKDGNVTGLVGISRDVTERMVAQEAVRKAKEDLEVRVQERTAALVQEIKEHLRTERALREGERMLQDANLRLESRVSQLHFLNAAAHRLAHYNHRRELLPAILETFARSYPGIEAAFCEVAPDGYHCAAATARLSNPGHKKACEAALAAQGLLGVPFLAADRKADPALSAIEWPGMDGFPVYAAVPLLVEDKSLAVVQLFAPAAFAAWFEQEKVLLNTLAAQTAISLSNANNFQELEKKARLQGELEVAQDIQRRFTPQDKPSIPRVNLKGVYHPAYEVGGDYLDYFQTESGNWVVVIADVSGKGIPAALVMTMLRSTFRAEARYEASAKKLLCAVNDLMIGDLDDKSFVTALCLIIDKDGKSMSYARAGHPPLLIQHGDNGSKPSPVNPKGLALGMVSGKDFADRLEEVTLELAHGDRYLIFTDGLLEAMDSERKFYGIKRLLDIMSGDAIHEPEKVLKTILDDVRVFIRSEPYHDDLTMLAMEVTG
ncbi:MAG TPA: PAS domain-containing protein [Fibrobacteria bacterium]|nr:PAS domain-containing protein [Fibrobacteria bacterium]